MGVIGLQNRLHGILVQPSTPFLDTPGLTENLAWIGDESISVEFMDGHEATTATEILPG